ncbi:MAG: hypothetical protein U0V74_08690 [Chitinophagales bacterium]
MAKKRRSRSKRNVQNCKILLPDNLDLQGLVNQYPPTFKCDIGFLVHLVGICISIGAYNPNLITKDGFVPFSSTLLQRKNALYNKHLKYLVDLGVLQVINNYKVGEKCKQYRIGEKFLSNKLKEVTIENKYLDQQMKVQISAKKKYNSLFKWFNNLNIDSESATEYTLNELELKKDKEYYQSYSAAYTKLYKIDMIKNQVFWFHKDIFGKRLHTNLTNIDSSLKQFIKYENESLISLDLKNSQPFLSLKLLQTQPLNTPYPIMLLKPSHIIDNEDVIRYINLVCCGNFYSYFEEEIRKDLGAQFFEKEFRYDFKKAQLLHNNLDPISMTKLEMFSIFFSKNEYQTATKELFKSRFPTVMGIFESYKAGTGNKYKELSKALQRLESHVFLDTIVPAITQAYPETPIFTIHDSIVTTIGNEQKIKEIMVQCIEAEIGYSPSIKLEYWIPPERQIMAA